MPSVDTDTGNCIKSEPGLNFFSRHWSAEEPVLDQAFFSTYYTFISGLYRRYIPHSVAYEHIAIYNVKISHKNSCSISMRH